MAYAINDQSNDTHGETEVETGLINDNLTRTTVDESLSLLIEHDTKSSDQQTGLKGMFRQDSRQAPGQCVPIGQTGDRDDGYGPGPISSPTEGLETNQSLALPVQDSSSLNGEVTYSWLKDLSQRMNSVEDNVNKSKDDSKKVKGESTDTEAASVEAIDTKMRSTIPQVRDCNWEQFKNRFPDENGISAVEVLLSSKTLDEEIEKEQLRRLTPERKIEVLRSRKEAKRPQYKGPGPRRLERVRINSAYVLDALAKASGEGWAGKPHTFLRPFKILVHHHSKMEEEYQELQAKMHAANIDNAATELPTSNEKAVYVAATNVEESAVMEQTHDLGPVAITSSCFVEDREKDQDDMPIPVRRADQKAYEDMECYIDFMRKQLIPVYTMFDQVDLSKSTKVRHRDLWSLFRVGELVIQRSKDKVDTGRDEAQLELDQQGIKRTSTATAEPLLGRVFRCSETRPRWEVDDLSGTGTGGRLHRDRNEDTDSSPEGDLECVDVGFYYIDYDGEDYGAVRTYFDIMQYSGEKVITSLPVYPLRFSKDKERILRDLQARGDKFHKIIMQPTHSNLSYQGWTLTRTPLGASLEEEKMEYSFKSPLYVQSDVIVDFSEAYQSRPWWKPSFSTMTRDSMTPQAGDDRFSIIRWADRDRKESIRREEEIVVYEDAVDNLELDQHLDSIEGKFLLKPEDRTAAQIIAAKDLSMDDFALLPPRLFAYTLRDRKFINANIRYMKLRPAGSSTFDKLRITDQHKSLIQSVVFEHFQKKQAQKLGISQDLEISDQDIIRGKGRGLVILLHGAPGVGKTATAEAIALTYNKPLFPITCGNLGTEPEKVEAVLTELFRLANLWDCILLLDEAEIFLSPREKKDDNLQRNAIVSVFLRILEYYSGILFLTTNRSGALDEAVKSRVHLSLLYPHLGYEETMSLFKMNIDRLAQIERETGKITGQQEMTIEENGIMDFAQRHFNKFAGMEDSRWNGRQIRNAFQIAASLARYQNHQQPHRGLFIGAEHFEKVEIATREYDDFRNNTARKTESEIAFNKGDRGPDFPPSDRRLNTQRSPGYHQHYPGATSPLHQRSWSSSSPASQENRGFGGHRSSQFDMSGSAQSSPFEGSTGFSTPMNRHGERPQPSPLDSMRSERGGDSGRDQ